jgi:F-type H+-transporting ATPase subunit epsilon
MRQFNLEIVTPDGEAFSGQAESIIVKTTLGDVEILYGHTDYFAALSTGIAKIKSNSKVRLASLSGGFISVKSGSVKVVATTFEFSDEIDKKRAERARERAEALLSAAKDEKESKIAKAKLARALTRIEASGAK